MLGTRSVRRGRGVSDVDEECPTCEDMPRTYDCCGSTADCVRESKDKVRSVRRGRGVSYGDRMYLTFEDMPRACDYWWSNSR